LTAHSHSDVLIVGAGSAGSVLAERLSADAGCTVTIIEAGPGPGSPGVAELTRDGTTLPVGEASPLVTRYRTVLTGTPQRSMSIVRGAVVGGSGSVNGGYFCRGLPGDFHAWGLPGWSWAQVLPHFRAVETDLDFPHESVHGDRGPIPVQRTHEIVGATASFVQAATDAGFGWLPDLNDGTTPGLPNGIGAVPLNIVDGLRIGPGPAFLEPASHRPNLCIEAGTRALRIRFDKGRAVGVEAAGPAGPATLTADRVVLSAGAIGTAQLLMVSGVGDESVLRAAGIAVTLAAPVGSHCADHPEWVLATNWAVKPARPVLEVVLSLAEGIEIRPYTGGFVTMAGGAGIGLPDRPHIGVALMTPRARGAITVVSPDPAVPPLIQHRYDSEPADVEALTRGAELARELAGSAADVGDPRWSTSQHLCGSVRMGDDGDAYAVVDSRCRVRGIENLWVVDGSVLPAVPSRGPHATTVMLGHRAAEFVHHG
jgi:choline dehydrogenase